MQREFLKGLGSILVVVGVIMLVWDAYAYHVDAGFQRDVPPLLSFGDLAVYAVLTVAAGVLALLGSLASKSNKSERRIGCKALESGETHSQVSKLSR